MDAPDTYPEPDAEPDASTVVTDAADASAVEDEPAEVHEPAEVPDDSSDVAYADLWDADDADDGEALEFPALDDEVPEGTAAEPSLPAAASEPEPGSAGTEVSVEPEITHDDALTMIRRQLQQLHFLSIQLSTLNVHVLHSMLNDTLVSECT